jgi:hypothetical protein
VLLTIYAELESSPVFMEYGQDAAKSMYVNTSVILFIYKTAHVSYIVYEIWYSRNQQSLHHVDYMVLQRTAVLSPFVLDEISALSPTRYMFG